MATIKEMAAKHNLCNNDQTTMAYRLGAIEVLEEIEDIVYRRYSNDADGTERNRDLIKLIRELKSE